MMFKAQTLAQPLLCGLLLTIIVNASEVFPSASFGIDSVGVLAKKLASEPFKPPQPIPDFLRQL
jgi:glucan biosynthesis protein